MCVCVPKCGCVYCSLCLFHTHLPSPTLYLSLPQVQGQCFNWFRLKRPPTSSHHASPAAPAASAPGTDLWVGEVGGRALAFRRDPDGSSSYAPLLPLQPLQPSRALEAVAETEAPGSEAQQLHAFVRTYLQVRVCLSLDVYLRICASTSHSLLL